MRRVYSASDPLDANLVRAWLVERGIDAIVEGESLWGTRGEIPFTPETSPSVNVPDEQFEQARELLANRKSEAAAAGPSWRCPECGETSEPQFTSCWSCGTDRASEDPADRGQVDERSSADVPSVSDEPESTETGDPLDVNEPAACRSLPWGTAAFVTAAVVMQYLVERAGGPENVDAYQQHGWRDAVAIWRGDWWAIPLATLFHHDRMHLLLNLAYILPLGWFAERWIGTLRFLALLAGATVFTSAVGMELRGDNGVGASGVAYALLAFCLVARTRVPLAPWPVLAVFVVISFTGLVEDAADFFTWLLGRPVPDHRIAVGFHEHLAGIIFGGLVALAFVHSWRPRLTRGLLAAMVAASLLFAAWAPWQPNWIAAKIQNAHDANDAASMIDWSTRYLALRPDAAEVRVSRGSMLRGQGDLIAAAADYDEAIRRDPDLTAAWLGRSLLSELRSDLAAAKVDLEAGLKRSPSAYDLRTARAVFALAEAQFDDAGRDLKFVLNRDADFADARYARGWLHLQTSRFDEALADFDHCLVVAPHRRADVLASRGFAQAEFGQRLLGERAMREAVALNQDQLALAPREPLIHLSLAELRTELGEFELAEQSIAAIFETAPEWWSAFATRGFLRLAQNRPKDALADFDAALLRLPPSHWARHGRARALRALGRSIEAFVDFNANLSENPRSHLDAAGVAGALVDLGRLQPAESEIASALELNPGSGESYWERARLRRLQGRDEEAKADRRRAIELDPRLVKRVGKAD